MKKLMLMLVMMAAMVTAQAQNACGAKKDCVAAPQKAAACAKDCKKGDCKCAPGKFDKAKKGCKKGAACCKKGKNACKCMAKKADKAAKEVKAPVK
jgi:hypothetical protein